MNENDLDDVLTKFDPGQCAQFFENATEKQRAALAAHVLIWWDVNGYPGFERQLGDIGNITDPDTLKTLRERASVPAFARDGRCKEVVKMAVLACCSHAQVKRLLSPYNFPKPHHADLVARHRTSTWLAQLAALLCKEDLYQYWPIIRGWERSGAMILQNRDSQYWFCMALGLISENTALDEVLRSDDQLLNDYVWHLLEDHEAIKKMLDHYALSEITGRAWSAALSKLANDGTLDRNRLAETALFTLCAYGKSDKLHNNRDLMTAIDWVIALHENLVSTPAERQHFTQLYLSLLGCRNTYILLWTLRTLQSMLENGLLSANTLLAQLDNVFGHEKKEPALEALRMTSALATAGKVETPELLMVLAHALEHKSVDVQKRALDAVEKFAGLAEPSDLENLRERLPCLAGLIKTRLSDWLQHRSQGQHSKATSTLKSDLEPKESPLSHLMDRCKALDNHWSELAGIPEILKTLQDSDCSVKRVPLESLEIPRLQPEALIHPIIDLDELVFACLAVLNKEFSADDFERAIDGISRLCDQRPADFAARTAALRKCAINMLDMDKNGFDTPLPFAGHESVWDLAGLIVSWLDGVELVSRAEPSSNRNHGRPIVIYSDNTTWEKPITVCEVRVDLNGYMSKRLLAIAARVAGKISHPLLSAPTHNGGWIDPVVGLDRLKVIQRLNVVPDSLDAVQMLLRLAPDNRSEALHGCSDLSGEIAAAFKYALGSQLDCNQVSSVPLWVAASRARQPHASDDALRACLGDRAREGPDLLKPAVFHPYKDHFGNSYRAAEGFLPGETFDPCKDPNRQFRELPHWAIDYPSLLMHAQSRSWYTVWPLCLEAYVSPNYWGDQQCWKPLFDQDNRLDGNASWALARTLNFKEKQAELLARDLLIAGIEDGRLDGREIGGAMGEILAAGDKVSIKQWAIALRETARVSSLHTLVVWQIVQQILKALVTPDPRSPVELLELAYDVCQESGEVIEDLAVRNYLSSISGKGKSAKLASELLKAKKASDKSYRANAIQLALSARISRAERWQQMAKRKLPVVAG